MTHVQAFFLIALVISAPALADPDPTPNPNATLVFIRKDCGTAPNIMENCFESMTELSGQVVIFNPTHPSPETNDAFLWNDWSRLEPIMVDIGPGTFESFVCPDNTAGPMFGNVTLRGSGRENTILEGILIGIDVNNCVNIDVMDLQALGELYGVRWGNGGNSTWTNVDMIAEADSAAGTFPSVGWVDDCTFAGEKLGLHYLFSVRSIARGERINKFAYVSSCAETWFFGGELRVEGEGSVGNTGLALSKGSDFRAFGSAIRAEGQSTNTTGVNVVGNGTGQTMFHMHGGIIAARSATGTALGLSVSSNGRAHTPGTAWIVSAPVGSATRISTSGGGLAQTPFLWQSGTDVPVTALASQNGSDMFVETDCNQSSGVCDGSGTSRPHMMIYDASCTPTPWFDIVTGVCRVD